MEEEEEPILNQSIFREYDIRGLVGSDLTPETVRLLGRTLGAYLNAETGLPPGTPVVVGRDNRASSENLARALTQGLNLAGYPVWDVGLAVTPMLYFARVLFDAKAAVMITGSHNPPEFNGFKIAAGGPSTIYGEQIQKLRRIAENLLSVEETPKDGRNPAAANRCFDSFPAYRSMIAEKITLGPRRLKVVLDAGNGTASPFAPTIFRDLGCEVIPLFCESDPDFPNHHPDPVKAKNLVSLQKAVLETKADLGIAFDGDADRIGAVDEKGQILYGDTLMALYWREILARHPGASAIIEVKCSQALVEEVERLGGKPFFYKTGHSLIKAKMKEIGAVFTGEMSGHMFFADEYFGFDDAIYAGARLLRILSNTDQPLSALTASIPDYCSTPEARVDCADDTKFEVVARMREYFKKTHRVIDVDGARVLFGSGWGLVRASNTQPVLVLRCEARTPEDLESIKKEMESALAEIGGPQDIDWL